MRFFGVVHGANQTVSVVRDTVVGDTIQSEVLFKDVSPIVAPWLVERLTALQAKQESSFLRCQNCGLYKTASVEATSCVTYEDDANPFGLLPVVGEHSFQSEN